MNLEYLLSHVPFAGDWKRAAPAMEEWYVRVAAALEATRRGVEPAELAPSQLKEWYDAPPRAWTPDQAVAGAVDRLLRDVREKRWTAISVSSRLWRRLIWCEVNSTCYELFRQEYGDRPFPAISWGES